METYYKLAKPDGWDWYTGETINYRDNVGKVVKPPYPDAEKGLCSSGLIHASKNPNDCFVGAKIPCSAYKVQGNSVLCDNNKCGFIELEVIEEITNLDTLLGWNYTEAINSVNPLEINVVLKDKHKKLLKTWASVVASVRDSVWDSVWASVRDSVWASVRASVVASVWESVRASVRDSVWASVRDSVRASVGDSVWASVRDSVWASVAAYIGTLFSNIKKWKYIDHALGVYPFQSAADLWREGFVPSFDGSVWRLHAGEKADIVYTYQVDKH